jgi:antitoxin component YwqK of YwqJK toxin-antitoxin module
MIHLKQQPGLYLRKTFFCLFMCMCIFTACDNDGKGLQEKLKRTLQGPTQQGNSTSKKITPSKHDKLALENSIKACPDEAKLMGKPHPQGKRQWCAYKDDTNEFIKHGEYRQWHPSGVLQISAYYEDDELSREFTEFYPNAQPKEKSVFIHGKRNGKSTQWSKEGLKLKEASYADDFLNGPYVEYLKDELPKMKGAYHGDKKHGVWEEYDNKGTLIRKVEYRNDLKHGRVTEYTNRGKIKANGFYDKDQQMGHWVHFDNEGLKQSEGNLINGKRHGRWIEYDKMGQPRRTTYFNDGKKMDSIAHRNNAQELPQGGSFGSKDILGSEPPIRRRNEIRTPPKKTDRPKPLKQEGWAPL